jgi:molybdopterin-guanine dinucleotide biosynthesis protein A
LDRSAVILAFSTPKGFEADKGTLIVDGKPLLARVVNAVEELADEVIVVTASQEQADLYEKLVSPEVRFVVSADAAKGPLAVALCGLEAAKGDYSLLLPFDSPFISSEVVGLLLDLSAGKAAVVPRTPDCEAEPLHTVYNTKQAIEVAKAAMAEGDFEVDALVERLRCIRFISTMVLVQLDADLKTFFRIITPVDLKKIAVLSKPNPHRTKKKKK